MMSVLNETYSNLVIIEDADITSTATQNKTKLNRVHISWVMFEGFTHTVQGTLRYFPCVVLVEI